MFHGRIKYMYTQGAVFMGIHVLGKRRTPILFPGIKDKRYLSIAGKCITEVYVSAGNIQAGHDDALVHSNR